MQFSRAASVGYNREAVAQYVRGFTTEKNSTAKGVQIATLFTPLLLLVKSQIHKKNFDRWTCLSVNCLRFPFLFSF